MRWLQHHTDELIERYEPAEALALLRQQDTLSPPELPKLDAYLQHWTLMLLQRPQDPQGVQDLLSLAEIAADLAAGLAGAEDSAMQQRWGAFEDLLEGKRSALQASRRAAPVELKHQGAIVQRIAQSEGGRVRQLELTEHLKLSKGRISQILGLMESRGLVTRQRQGQDSWVSLATSGSAPGPAQAQLPASSPAPTLHIGQQVFALHRVA